jgi:PAS domain S-box-containing protein
MVARIFPPKLIRPVAIAAAYLIIFLAFDKLSSIFVTSANVSPWYPPPGVSLVLLLVCGLYYTPVVFLAVILSATLVYNELSLGLPGGQLSLLAFGTALTISFGYGSMAFILKHWLKINLRLNQPRDMFALIAVILIGPIAVALVSVAILVAVGLTPPSGFGDATFNFWIGDTIGLLVIVPVALVIVIPGWQMVLRSGVRSVWRWLQARRLIHLGELLAQTAAALLVLWMTFVWSSTSHFHMYYLCFLPLIWTSLRFGLRGAVIGNLVFNVTIVLGATIFNYSLESLTDLQLFMLILCLTGLVLGATVSQRQNSEDALRESEQRFRAILEASPTPILITRVSDGIILYANADTWPLFEIPLEEHLIGRKAIDLYYDPADRQLAVNAFRDQGQVHDLELRMKNARGRMFWILLSSRRTMLDGTPVLISSFYDITERKQMEEELRQLNSALEARVSERTAELRSANERLKELDRLKSKFVADVSHELRTPITGLQMRVYLMERSPERLNEHVVILTDYVQRLAELVRSVLDLSRLDLGKKVAFAPVNLNAVIDREIAIHHSQAQSAGVGLTLELDKRLPLVRGEANQLGQVVSNLVGNAIRYTPRGDVRLRTFTDAKSGQVSLEVSDSGLGIAPEDVPHLFERFYRGQTALKADIPGSGLGLSIVKEIVELHKGSISVESKVGQGTTFRISLPAESAIESLPLAANSGK